MNEGYKCNYNCIELVITYRCNLGCYNCDAQCSQAPSDIDMSVGQIHKFIQESLDSGKRWERIRILGGEPTLHPHILVILNILLGYTFQHSQKTQIQLVTNGHGEKVKKILSLVPKSIHIENSNKLSKQQDSFVPVNLAPCDVTPLIDFSKGCWVTSTCGIALTPYGYFPCSVAGGIDRVFGKNLGQKKLPKGNLESYLHTFCNVCGHFNPQKNSEQVYSPTWLTAIENFESNPPKLDFY